MILRVPPLLPPPPPSLLLLLLLLLAAAAATAAAAAAAAGDHVIVCGCSSDMPRPLKNCAALPSMPVQTERVLREKLSNLQLDLAAAKQQHDAKIDHLDRELQQANETALAVKDELFTVSKRSVTRGGGVGGGGGMFVVVDDAANDDGDD